jgi:hypothetical protein
MDKQQSTKERKKSGVMLEKFQGAHQACSSEKHYLLKNDATLIVFVDLIMKHF